jgi:hypothetical protein
MNACEKLQAILFAHVGKVVLEAPADERKAALHVGIGFVVAAHRFVNASQIEEVGVDLGLAGAENFFKNCFGRVCREVRHRRTCLRLDTGRRDQ